MTPASSPRVLTCAYNNRRRNRIHPVTHPNIINNNNNNGTMNIQTSKPSKPIASLKIRKDITRKLSMNDEPSENIGDWPTLLSKGSTHEKTLKILPVEEASSQRAELSSYMEPSIFRQMADYDDQDDMMLLKRANPVYDSDDNDDYNSIPSKRQRTSGETTVLQWGEQLEESSDGFSLMGLYRE